MPSGMGLAPLEGLGVGRNGDQDEEDREYFGGSSP
jgi:hypothetical protein